MIRHRHGNPQPRDVLLAMKADNAGQPAPWPSVGDPIEIDERDRLLRPVHVTDAGAQARGHEGEVRIGVPRLNGAFL